MLSLVTEHIAIKQQDGTRENFDLEHVDISEVARRLRVTHRLIIFKDSETKYMICWFTLDLLELIYFTL